MCNAYTISPRKGGGALDIAISSAIQKLPQFRVDAALIRRTGMGIVVLEDDGKLRPEIMRWGIDHAKWKTVNNARTESLKRGMWVEPMKSSRCLVPLSAFYEWQELTPKSKQPYRIHSPRDGWTWVAGLYGRTESGDGQYATITTAPTEEFAPIHDRLLAVIDFEQGLEFIQGGDAPRDPTGSRLIWEPCESPLKKPPEGPQASLF